MYLIVPTLALKEWKQNIVSGITENEPLTPLQKSTIEKELEERVSFKGVF